MDNSDLSMNLSRGDSVWRADREPALDNLMARILERDNVAKAWERVKSNKGAPGSDGMSLEDFPVYAREHWHEIRQSLLEGGYQPRPVRRVVIPKPKGKGERKLGIPCVLDRVIQQAILQVLTPISHPYCPTSCWMSWIRSLKPEGIALFAMSMTWSSWSKADGPGDE